MGADSFIVIKGVLSNRIVNLPIEREIFIQEES